MRAIAMVGQKNGRKGLPRRKPLRSQSPCFRRPSSISPCFSSVSVVFWWHTAQVFSPSTVTEAPVKYASCTMGFMNANLRQTVLICLSDRNFATQYFSKESRSSGDGSQTFFFGADVFLTSDCGFLSKRPIYRPPIPPVFPGAVGMYPPVCESSRVF